MKKLLLLITIIGLYYASTAIASEASPAVISTDSSMQELADLVSAPAGALAGEIIPSLEQLETELKEHAETPDIAKYLATLNKQERFDYLYNLKKQKDVRLNEDQIRKYVEHQFDVESKARGIKDEQHISLLNPYSSDKNSDAARAYISVYILAPNNRAITKIEEFSVGADEAAIITVPATEQDGKDLGRYRLKVQYGAEGKPFLVNITARRDGNTFNLPKPEAGLNWRAPYELPSQEEATDPVLSDDELSDDEKE